MKLINSPSFNGYPVLSKHGALVENILTGNEQVLVRMLNIHNRVAVMRCELKFPAGFADNTEVISKAFDSIRYRINSDLRRKADSRGRVINSDIGYIWVKEKSGNQGWHYHVALFLNYDVYNCFGLINSSNMNMYNRVLLSWASALGLHPDDAKGLVHIPNNPIYKLDCNSVSINEDMHDVLYRLSYLAKVHTKPYGEGYGIRFFGTSQR